MEARKADKKETLDTRQKLQLALDLKIDKQEVHAIFSDFTKDQSQKSYNFRKELFEKIRDIEKDITSSIGQFVHQTEFTRMLESKADATMFQQLNGSKAAQEEVESLRRALDRLSHEFESKQGFKDLEIQQNYTKGCIEDLNKELLLKVSVSDLCKLLD